MTFEAAVADVLNVEKDHYLFVGTHDEQAYSPRSSCIEMYDRQHLQ